ncbi:MAG: SET domain-containing protein-lysine N-methyltransferase [Candidatus Thiodiazotropha sp.]
MSEPDQNQRIERMITDHELEDRVYSGPSEIHGTGLFARKAITEGEYIGTFDGPKVDENDHHVLWVYESDDDTEPTGRKGENLLRFLNHSQDFNAEFDGFDLYALRDIKQDEEITFDYGW